MKKINIKINNDYTYVARNIRARTVVYKTMQWHSVQK